MASAGVRELKNNLSRYLRRVAAGERILVTDHGRVIAELTPPTLERRGALPPSAIRLPVESAHPFLGWPIGEKIELPPGSAARLIDEDRGES
ncbi:MAG TPA: type II toxin-antitoxin system prevent-host-death family antitoxin [Gemmatimonadaceae bacterium]|nr:type II toxin-antitoxin system prevent-host-death family antitoxin [Gemmatimonadaceae bacterium]